jgi:hypothetical protein
LLEANIVDNTKPETDEAWAQCHLGLLRKLANALSRTIKAWEAFKDGEIQYFCLPVSDSSPTRYGTYFATIDKDFKELCDLRSSLLYQQEVFENMINVSLLRKTLSRF